MIQNISNFIWQYPAPVFLLSIFLYFTLKTKGIQLKAWKGIKESIHTENSNGESISSLSSLTTTLAATLGTGNIIGLSLAVAIGGPGAVFWCWITGILGMACSYSEAYICKKYKSGSVGGPMDVLNNTLNMKTTGKLYAIGIVVCSLITSAAIQSRAISDAVSSSAHIPRLICGIITALLVLLTLSGGSKTVHSLCLKLVPVMAGIFLLGIILILLINISYIPDAVKLIVKGAFSPVECLTGTGSYVAGNALRQGIARGIFTNEAGLGTSAIPATETGNTPHTQGLITMSATFWDTVVLCGITGIALVSCMISAPDEFISVSSENYISAAFGLLGHTGTFCLNISIIIFAFATLIGWAHFGETACRWLDSRPLIHLFPYLYSVMCALGACLNISSLFSLSDLSSVILLSCNSVILIKLGKSVKNSD